MLLLPYSLVGPFAGVFLDRWRRQRVLVLANLARSLVVAGVAGLVLTSGARSVAFYATALLAISVNRFYLAALSAALPHVVDQTELVAANSLATTSGTVVTFLGGGLGLAVRQVAGHGDVGSAVIALSAAVGYVGSALVGTSLRRDQLGPDQPVLTSLRRAVGDVARGLAAGAHHVAHRRHAAAALLAITSHRLYYGVSTIATLLLYRNYFSDHGLLRAGLSGLAEVFAAGLVGVVVAASLTPWVTRRTSKQRWTAGLFLLAGVVELALGLPFRQAPLLVAALLLGLAAQGSKICVDTIVQEDVADVFRGRVFSFYDTLFNVAFVAAAVVGAVVLPADGKAPVVIVGVAAGYLLTAAVYGWAERRVPQPVPPTTGPAARPRLPAR